MKQAFVRTTCAAFCIALLASSAHAQDKSGTTGDTAKFGVIELATAGISIFQAINNWSANRVQGAAPGAPATQAQSSPIALAVNMIGQVVQAATGGQQGAWVPTPQPFAANAAQTVPYTQAPYYSPAPMIVGQPDIALAGQAAFDPNKPWDNSANYQGVTVAALMLDERNQVVETRSLAGAFRTGERFKLRIVSTFDAIVSLDSLRAQAGSIGATGVMTAPPTWVGQLYPARADQVVQVRAGQVVQLPVGPNEYFTFEGQTGTELLALNVRHPQASNAQINRQPVYRQDAAAMTSYSQLAQPGTYSALTQILALQHSR